MVLMETDGKGNSRVCQAVIIHTIYIMLLERTYYHHHHKNRILLHRQNTAIVQNLNFKYNLSRVQFLINADSLIIEAAWAVMSIFTETIMGHISHEEPHLYFHPRTTRLSSTNPIQMKTMFVKYNAAG